MDMTPADLDEAGEDEFDEDDEGEPEDDERAGHTRRWVRYVMPVMVEVDCDTDEITSVVTLPGEVRLGCATRLWASRILAGYDGSLVVIRQPDEGCPCPSRRLRSWSPSGTAFTRSSARSVTSAGGR